MSIVVHLPEAILGVHQPLRKEGIMDGMRAHMWNAKPIANDLNGSLEPWQLQGACELWHRFSKTPGGKRDCQAPPPRHDHGPSPASVGPGIRDFISPSVARGTC